MRFDRKNELAERRSEPSIKRNCFMEMMEGTTGVKLNHRVQKLVQTHIKMAAGFDEK